MDIKRGDIVIADLGDTIGSEQGKRRPAIIIQNDIGNLYSPTTIVVPLTSHIKKTKQITHALIRKTVNNGLKCDSMALCEQVRAIDKSRICMKIGAVDDNFIMEEIFNAYIANFQSSYGEIIGGKNGLYRSNAERSCFNY